MHKWLIRQWEEKRRNAHFLLLHTNKTIAQINKKTKEQNQYAAFNREIILSWIHVYKETKPNGEGRSQLRV